MSGQEMLHFLIIDNARCDQSYPLSTSAAVLKA